MKFILISERHDSMRPPDATGRRWLAGLLIAGLPLLTLGSSEDARFKNLFLEPLDSPAVMTARVPKVETIGVAKAGQALVAVGARGSILRSDDAGTKWTQVASPVSTDLVGAFFIDSLKGWAWGHDGVILVTSDSGKSWARQLDGRDANRVLRASYDQLKDAEGDYVKAALPALERIAPSDKSILPLPILDVWFSNASEGYAVGAFNLLMHSTDGGKTWVAWDHLTDNPKGYHLNAVGATPGGLFIVGERGLVMRWNDHTHRFSALETGYKGSFFGIYGDAKRTVVYGLRGNARITSDGGKTWEAVKLATVGNIVKVTENRAGELLFALQDGTVKRRAADGTLLEVKVDSKRSGEVAGAIFLEDGRLLTAGIRGPVISTLFDVNP